MGERGLKGEKGEEGDKASKSQLGLAWDTPSVEESGTTDSFTSDSSTSDTASSPDTSSFSSSGTESDSSDSSDLTEQYSNSKYGFSFNYPAGFTIGEFPEGDIGETILVQNPESSQSFQVFVADYDEPGPITPERILQDLPTFVIENPQEAILPGNVEALIFFSQEEGLGKTREVWIVHGGYLYQITTEASMDAWLAGILNTWHFTR